MAALKHLDQAVTGAGGIALRFCSFYGDPNDGLVAAVRARKFPIVGDGGGVWSHIHLEDAAATVLALEHDGPAIYNIVDDEPAPTRVWLPELAKIVAAKPPQHFPRLLARLCAGEPLVVMATESRGASTAKAKRELGWTLRDPSWRAGLRSGLRSGDHGEGLTRLERTPAGAPGFSDIVVAAWAPMSAGPAVATIMIIALHGAPVKPAHPRWGLLATVLLHLTALGVRHDAPGGPGWPCGYASARTAAAIRRTRWGSPKASIATILPAATVKPRTANGRPPTVTTTPAAPFTSAGCRSAARFAARDACPATANAP
jgi:hypothetical protein